MGRKPASVFWGDERDSDSRELRKENAAALDVFPKVRNNWEAVVAERGDVPDVEAIGRGNGCPYGMASSSSVTSSSAWCRREGLRH